MKTLFFIFTAACVFIHNAGAQDYLINFEVSANLPLNFVKVENLTTGESLTLNGTDVLNLKGNLELTGSIPSSGIKIYPNPMTDNARIQIYPTVAGEAVITVLDLSGRVITRIKDNMDNSLQEFKISGEAARGLYIVNVIGTNYQLSSKLLCNGSSSGTLSIEKISGSSMQVTDMKASEMHSGKSGSEMNGRITGMLYSPGNTLKFTAMSGDYQTVLTDIPDKNKTIIFDIKESKDRDGNKYHTVEIDGRVWSAENLKTTKYNNGTSLPLVADSALWSNLTTPGYCWYNNNETAYKNPYGALYNAYVIKAGDVCPEGWHISTDAEWTSLRDYLSVNSNAFGIKNDALAKSIASTSRWNVYTYVHESRGPMEVIGAVGMNQATTNNSTGFNGYPGGLRSFTGSFSEIGKTGVWFSSVAISLQPDAGLWDWYISYNNMRIEQGSDDRSSGFSVRCIEN